MGLITENKIFKVEHYFASKLFSLCQKAFQEAFPNEEVPKKPKVHYLLRKFHETGSVCNHKNESLVITLWKMGGSVCCTPPLSH
jgi:hypothetical protein